ncbi:MAG: hypothetical protein Q9217_001685 [Psora testacea]
MAERSASTSSSVRDNTMNSPNPPTPDVTSRTRAERTEIVRGDPASSNVTTSINASTSSTNAQEMSGPSLQRPLLTIQQVVGEGYSQTDQTEHVQYKQMLARGVQPQLEIPTQGILMSQPRPDGPPPPDMVAVYPQGVASPFLRPHSPPPNGVSMYRGLLQMKQGEQKSGFQSIRANANSTSCRLDLHFPRDRPPTNRQLREPITLLTPECLAEVDLFYEANRTILSELWYENERHRRVWSGKFGRMPSDSTDPTHTAVGTGSLGSVHSAYTATRPRMPEPSYQPPMPPPAPSKRRRSPTPQEQQPAKRATMAPSPVRTPTRNTRAGRAPSPTSAEKGSPTSATEAAELLAQLREGR